MKTICAADANRHFSSLLQDVSLGEEVVVISRGKPVARILGIKTNLGSAQAAHKNLINRLRQQLPSGERQWTRADLYE